MTQARQPRPGSGDDPVHRGPYAPGGIGEVNPAPGDPFHAEQELDPDDPADARVDPEVLRNGGGRPARAAR